jgi:hypothetical protein
MLWTKVRASRPWHRFGSPDELLIRDCLDPATAQNVFADEVGEVLVPVADLDLSARVSRELAGPGGLPSRPVAVEPSAADGDPVPEPAASLGDLATMIGNAVPPALAREIVRAILPVVAGDE